MRIGIQGAMDKDKQWNKCRVLWEPREPHGFLGLASRLSLAAYLRKHFPVIQDSAGNLASKGQGRKIIEGNVKNGFKSY